MNFYVFSILLILSVYIPTLVLCAGRRPQPIEQTQCRIMFADRLNPEDRRARLEAYNIGPNGSLCETTCRIRTRGRITPMEPIPSPDFVTCSISGPRYCYRGSCSTSETILKVIKANSNSNSDTNERSKSTPKVTTETTTPLVTSPGDEFKTGV